MIQKVLGRLAWAAFVVWATVSLTFLVNHALPSDPARMVAGAQARPEDVERIRRDLGLDQSMYVQYARFFRRLIHVGPHDVRADDSAHATCAAVLGPVHVDLGRSYQLRRPVVALIAERFPRTLLLAVAASLLQAVFGTLAGTIAASNKRTLKDHLAVLASLLGVSAPTFIIGLFLQWLVAYRLRLLPLDGYGETLAEHLACLVLPALTLGIFGAAYYTRLVRDEMIWQLGQDYVRTARAKGLSHLAVVVRHALRNAVAPIVTVLGLELGTLIGGAIVTEAIFRWPGLGSLSVNAMLDRDGPVIMGSVIVTSVSVVVMTIAVDLAYGFLDPRTLR
ncbi:MAG: ABC transporter permease [Polyangiaceae bacterium]|nr:ABC transporter permease [Polyangiaceae bacterium]